MVQANYNPFKEKLGIETEHGIITESNRRYFTHRKPEHIFKKYQAFAISLSEIEIMKKYHVDHIVIKYHGKEKNTLYKIKMAYLQYFKTYDNEGDEQIIIPIKEMLKIGEEEK